MKPSLALLFLVASCTPVSPGPDGGVAGPCETSSDCDRRSLCLEGICAPRCVDNNACPTGMACRADGLCVVVEVPLCAGDSDCAFGRWCDGGACKTIRPGLAPLCRSCTGVRGECGDDANRCLTHRLSETQFCGLDCSGTQCPEGYECVEREPGVSQCIPRNDSACREWGQLTVIQCEADAQCPHDTYDCTDYRCVKRPDTPCAFDVECARREQCTAGECELTPPSSCLDDAECETGFSCVLGDCSSNLPPPGSCDLEGLAWSDWTGRFFVTYCVGCHVELADYDAVVGYTMSITAEVVTAPYTMPPGILQPLEGERRSLERWLQCGAPE